MLALMGVGAMGMSAQQAAIDGIADNLANINTAGFKKNRVEFSEIFSQAVDRLGIGGGVLAGSTRDFVAGPIETTGRALDLAVDGDGFFVLNRPDNSTAYTRDGTFYIDAQGHLVNSAGWKAVIRGQGTGVIPPGADVLVDPAGKVTAMVGGVPKDVGHLQLASISAPETLTAVGVNAYALPAGQQGSVQLGYAGQRGIGRVLQGAREGSNVDLAEEMTNLIMAQRTYQFNLKVVQEADQLWSLANSIYRG